MGVVGGPCVGFQCSVSNHTQAEWNLPAGYAELPCSHLAGLYFRFTGFGTDLFRHDMADEDPDHHAASDVAWLPARNRNRSFVFPLGGDREFVGSRSLIRVEESLTLRGADRLIVDLHGWLDRCAE